jgi:DNA-directed RNA polymerase subunit RPC12/RpoP
MKDFETIKCPACGASDIKSISHSMGKCSYCGSKFLLTEKQLHVLKGNKPTWIIVLALVLVISALAIYLLLQRNKPKETPLQIKKPSIGIPNLKVNLPTINAKAMTISQEDLKQNPDALDSPKVSILHTVKGVTSQGGIYWIMTLRNDSEQAIIQAGAVVSLLTSDNKRLEEQKGYSKISPLQPQQETSVLVYIANPPKQDYHIEFDSFGSYIKYIKPNQAFLNVTDFTVKPTSTNSSLVNIIGDISNNNTFPVKFAKVIAIAKDANGNAIGLAEGFVTHSNLAPKATSGFKISAGTFVTQSPQSWELLAVGMK